MAKKSRKIRTDTDTVVGTVGAANLGLDEPFPAPPSRNGEYCLYCHKGGRLMNFIACTQYAVRKFLDILLQDDEVSIVKGITGEMDTIVASCGVTVRIPTTQGVLEETINYEYSKDEEEWGLPEPYVNQAQRFRLLSNDPYVPTEEQPASETGERPKREKKEKVVRPSKEGLITIGEIAAQLKIEARDARAALRKAKVEKPEGVGWCWQKKDVEGIKELIIANVK